MSRIPARHGLTVMCGICGVIGTHSAEEAESVVRRMLPAIVRRGPDEEGILVSPNLAAGIRRLSIIDVPGGSQPIWNETGTLAVVFNGEIYNHRELRAALERAGHRFRTNSDTEAIVHSYAQWGEHCLDRLRGMFALGIIEMPNGRAGRAASIFLARDRLGIKPLYYAFTAGTLLFASEVRALLASGQIQAALDSESLRCYLLFGSVGEPATLIEQISSVPPGHFLKFPAEPPLNPPSAIPYGSFSNLKSSASVPHSPHSVAEASTHVRALLEDSVRCHLEADVPVGVFLSSGIDSTALAALAARGRSQVRTFTVGFPDAGFSEAEEARHTAASLGTQHTELMLSASDVLARIEEPIAAFDQPSMDGINTFFVSWAAHAAGLKVALSGLGSDEIFGGYRTFRTTALTGYLARLSGLLPRHIRRLAQPGLRALLRSALTPDASRKILSAWRYPESHPHPYFFTRALFPISAAHPLLRANGNSSGPAPWTEWLDRAAAEVADADSFTAISWLEMRSYLVNTLLRDTDAMSMWHSLEVRVPFLDSPLVEYVLSLPKFAKYADGIPKGLLLAALGDNLPERIRSSPKKTFTFPWHNWLRGPLEPRIHERLAEWSPELEPFVSRDFAMGVWRDFRARRTSWSRPWSLYVLNEWVKRHLRPADLHASAFAGMTSNQTHSARTP